MVTETRDRIDRIENNRVVVDRSNDTRVLLWTIVALAVIAGLAYAAYSYYQNGDYLNDNGQTTVQGTTNGSVNANTNANPTTTTPAPATTNDNGTMTNPAPADTTQPGATQQQQ